MFNLSLVRYEPKAPGMEILRLLAEGYEPREVAAELKITPAALRQRIMHLKLNLGVNTFGQLMYEFGKYQKANE